MKNTIIYGFDFTSAPSKQKPITCAVTTLSNSSLTLCSLISFITHEAFEDFLQNASAPQVTTPTCDAESGWIAGIDAPFGQPLVFRKHAKWPETWQDYIAHASALSKEDFEQAIYSFMEGQPKGFKLRKRDTDSIAKAVSPMALRYVPVGKMFHALAPVLQRLDAAILPMRPLPPSTKSHTIPSAKGTVLETYPALTARAILGKSSYKDGKKEQHAERSKNRSRLIKCLPDYCKKLTGISLRMPSDLTAQMKAELSGDSVDALICAIQAAWASTQLNYGVPPLTEDQKNEGWIVSPEMPR